MPAFATGCIERLERVERAELGQPRVAELAEVGKRIPGVGRQQLLVRRGPGQLLHAHANVGMAGMKCRKELGHDLGLPPHRPEVEGAVRVVGTAAAGDGECGRAGRQLQQRLPARLAPRLVRAHGAGPVAQAVLASQPPSNPARCRPRRSGSH
jgi:hypothetical protein